MSYFKHLKLSKKGEQLQAKINGNLSETLTFTKAELGGGNIESEEEIRFLTSLKEKWGDAVISKCELQGEEKTMVSLELQFTNAELQENKVFRELGLYARGNDGEEVLYAYANAGENYDYIPLMKDSPHSFIITIYFTVSSGTKIDANIDLNGYVSLQTFKEKIKEIEENLKEKEPKFEKKSGFNLEKTQDYKKNNPLFLLNTKGSKKLFDDVMDAINTTDKCHYKVGDIYITTNSTNPAVLWIGTTWEKIEGKFLRATSSSWEEAGISGGSDYKTLGVENLPRHNHTGTVASNGEHTHLQEQHSHGKGNMEITGNFTANRSGADASGAFEDTKQRKYGSGDGGQATYIRFSASKTWNGVTTAASPTIQKSGVHSHSLTIGNTGDGEAFDIKPRYMTAHIWKRIS